jgi:hypothetical protein
MKDCDDYLVSGSKSTFIEAGGGVDAGIAEVYFAVGHEKEIVCSFFPLSLCKDTK